MSETTPENEFVPIPAGLSEEMPSLNDVAPVPEPAIEVTEPAVMASAAPAETLKPGGIAIQTAIVAAVFLIIGFIGGAIAFGRSASADEIAAIVRSVVAEEVANIGSGSLNMTEIADDDPSFGPDDAPVTIVEFSDFFCTYCTRFANETLPLLQEQYGDHIRFVYRDLPIIGGQVSLNAAVAASCAFDQDKFWEFHNILFANNAARDREMWIGFASELGMDAEAFTVCLDDPAKQEEITLDYIDGQGLGITGTPAFFINGRQVSGAQPFNTFAIVIDDELRKLGIEPPARITPGA